MKQPLATPGSIALAAIACAWFVVAAPAGATVGRSHSVPAVRTSAPPAFDASLSDPAWSSAVVAQDFEDITTRRPAPLGTTALLLYDQTNVYVGFRVQQDGVPIHAEQSTNDVGFGQDDAVGVCFDTSGSGTQSYCFASTPRASCRWFVP